MNVDVIIPIYNQRDSLLLTLMGFNNQTETELVHIIIIDDGSDENCKDVVTRYDSLDITYIYQKNKGRAYARNIALKYTKYDYVIFNDADRIPNNWFIRHHIDRLIANNNQICIGAIQEIYLNPSKEKEIFHIIKNESRLAREPLHSQNIDFLYDDHGVCLSKIPWISTYSGNMAIKKSILEEIGGFDVNFTDWGFEHFELGYRLFKMGISFVRERKAKNYHIAHKRENNFYLKSIIKSHEYFYNKHTNLDVKLLKSYMIGELSLQEYEHMVAGVITWKDRADKPLYIRLM